MGDRRPKFSTIALLRLAGHQGKETLWPGWRGLEHHESTGGRKGKSNLRPRN